MSPVASADRRPGSAGRVRAVVVLGVLALVAALAYPQSARAEPPGPADWVYEFADFTATPATTDYDHRTVTLTGELLRHRSYGGPAEPAAEERVDLVQAAGSLPSDGGSGSGSTPGTTTGSGGDTSADGRSLGTVTTDETGRFELPAAEIDQRPDQAADPVPGPFTVVVSAVHQADPEAADTGSGAVQAQLAVTATPSTARLTVDYTLGAVTGVGRTVTAQGVLERDTLVGRLPVQGTTVTVEYRPATAPALHWQTATGPDGRFSVTFTASAGGTAVTSADWSADPYLDLAGADGLSRQVAVPPPTPSPTATTTAATTAAVPPASVPPADRATAPGPVARSTPPTSLAPPPTTAEPEPAPPSDLPRTLAVTGGGTPRAALLTGGSTMLAAGLLLMVVRRRIRAAG